MSIEAHILTLVSALNRNSDLLERALNGAAPEQKDAAPKKTRTAKAVEPVTVSEPEAEVVTTPEPEAEVVTTPEPEAEVVTKATSSEGSLEDIRLAVRAKQTEAKDLAAFKEAFAKLRAEFNVEKVSQLAPDQIDEFLAAVNVL